MVTVSNLLSHLHDSLAPAGTCLLSRWWMWAGVFWWTGCRTTSRARLSTTSWTSMCTLTPSTCVGTERATTTSKAASEETQNFLLAANRYDFNNLHFMNCKASVFSKPNYKPLSGRCNWNIMNTWVLTFITFNRLHFPFSCLCQLNMNLTNNEQHPSCADYSMI